MKNIEEKYLKSGYIINDVEEESKIRFIKNSLIKECKKFLKKGSNFDLDLNDIHKYVGKDLNRLRIQLINLINKNPKFAKYLFDISKSILFKIVGNELAVQKNINLSIQCPKDKSSLLPIHSDTWDGNSPFDVVLWVPLVDCYSTKSMFILNAKNYNKFEKIYSDKKTKSADQIFKLLKPNLEFIKIKYGQFLLFNQNLPHGNIVNNTKETRISINYRFKGLFTPYRQKQLGTFFKPLIIKPATKIGFKYKFPGLK